MDKQTRKNEIPVFGQLVLSTEPDNEEIVRCQPNSIDSIVKEDDEQEAIPAWTDIRETATEVIW